MTIFWINLVTEDLSAPSFQVEVSSGPTGWGKKFKMKEIGSNLYKHGRFQARSLMFIKEQYGKKARPAVLSEDLVLPKR